MQTQRGFVSVVISMAILVGLAVAPAFAQTDDYGTGTTSGTYCPQLFQTVVRGSSGNQVLELQKFLSDYYDISPATIQTGYFGRITQGYVQQFQREQGLPSFGIAGSLTRAAIAMVCGSGNGSTTFTATPTSGAAPLTVTFAAAKGSNRYAADFGDGQVKSMDSCPEGDCSNFVPSIRHTFTAPGTYTAKLIATNTGACLPKADLSYSSTCVVGSVLVTVAGTQSATLPTIRVVSPNGGEILNAGSATTVQWDASNIPATTYNGSAQVSYKIGLALINSSGDAVGGISSGGNGYDRDLFEGTARSTQWNPASLNGGFSALNQLKVRAYVIKRTNQCITTATAYSSLATSPIACISEKTVTSDDSDGWFSVKGATVCNNKVSPMVCTQS